MKMKKILLPLFAGAIALSLAACGDKDEEKKTNEAKTDEQAFEEMEKKLEKQRIDDKTIVVEVNDEAMTGELYNMVLQSVQQDVLQSGQDPTEGDMPKSIQEQTVDVLINQALILQEANKENIKVTDKEFDERYEMYLEQVGGEEEALETALEAENTTVDKFKDSIRESILFEKYQEKVIDTKDISKKEIQKYYDELAAQSEEAEGEQDEFPPLKDIEDNIKTLLQQQAQQEALMEHIETLKTDAKITIKL